MMIKIDAPLKPVPFKRAMTSGKRRYNPAGYTEFKDELGYFALKAMAGREPLKSPIKITAEIFTKYEPYTLNAGDWDNHAKAISDALNQICYEDDRQIVEGHVYLFKGEPHISIELEELK